MCFFLPQLACREKEQYFRKKYPLKQTLYFAAFLSPPKPIKNLKLKNLVLFVMLFLLTCQLHGYNTRNASSFHVPKCRTNIILLSFQYQGPNFFNSFCSEIQNSTSLAASAKIVLLIYNLCAVEPSIVSHAAVICLVTQRSSH